MRKIINIVLVALFITGCEVIREEERLIPVDVETSNGRRHVLLDCTGFRCVNCPIAAETAQSLSALYGEQLIVVALHPASNPFTQGLYDYTCPAADSIYRFMGGTASTPFPTGNIDLTRNGTGYFSDPAEWGGLLHSAMNDTTAPTLSMVATIDTTSRLVDATAYIAAKEGEEMRLAIWLTEDSVIGVQAMPDGSVNMQYTHRHVLRTTAFESPWGEKVRMGNMVLQRRVTFPLPEGCDVAKCHAIGILMNSNDKYILQAYETNLDVGTQLP